MLLLLLIFFAAVCCCVAALLLLLLIALVLLLLHLLLLSLVLFVFSAAATCIVQTSMPFRATQDHKHIAYDLTIHTIDESELLSCHFFASSQPNHEPS